MNPAIFTFAIGLLAMACPGTASAQSILADSLRKIDSVNTLNRTFTKVEIESDFPGGAAGWLQFLNTHLYYPKKAYKKGIEGTVVLQFIVDKDGSVSNIVALTGDPILQEAAINVMAKSPRWNPAMQDGRIVKSYKKQPIVFRLTTK